MDKKIYQEEMCGSRCSILMYINLFNYKHFFWNSHFDRADNTFTCAWERGSFQDPDIQFSSGSNDGNFSIIEITCIVIWEYFEYIDSNLYLDCFSWSHSFLSDEAKMQHKCK